MVVEQNNAFIQNDLLVVCQDQLNYYPTQSYITSRLRINTALQTSAEELKSFNFRNFSDFRDDFLIFSLVPRFPSFCPKEIIKLILSY